MNIYFCSNSNLQSGKDIGLWYAKNGRGQGREKEQSAIVNYLHLSVEQRSLLETLVKRIDSCESSSTGGFLSSSKSEAGNSTSRRSFMDDYYQNVEANMKAEMRLLLESDLKVREKWR